MHVRHGQYSSAMQRDNHFHSIYLRKLLKQVARQDSRHGGPEESRDTKLAYCLKLAQLRWAGHVIRMPNERLPKKVFSSPEPKAHR